MGKKLFLLSIVFFPLIASTCDLEPKSKPALSRLAYTPNEGTWYEIMPGSFYDSDGDGIGDLKGITMKLDYLNDTGTPRHQHNMDTDGECNESLHVNGVWLTPIHPSPSYHKYDVKDYKAVDPQFGTMDDLQELLKECHKRGIKLIIDMVMNHTSDQHPWFQKALEEIRSGKPGRYASYYHFWYGATPPQRESVEYGDWYWAWDGYWQDGKFIPNRGIKNRFYRCWGKVMDGVWYEGSFWTGMPDLNWDSYQLREEFKEIVEFWLGEGLDGFRLDAVHYFYDWNEIGQMEEYNVPIETHEKNIGMLKWFNATCRAINPNVYLVGECYRDWDQGEIISSYYKSGMNFFYFQTRYKIKDALDGKGYDWAQTLRYFDYRIKAWNSKAIMAPFLSNHDMDRSFYNMGWDEDPWDKNPTMQGDDRRRFAASLTLLCPGTPFIYYGEEIGLTNNYVDYWSDNGQNNNYEFAGDPKRAKDDSDMRGPMWWSNNNPTGIPNPPENRKWSWKGKASRYGNGVGEQLTDDYSLLKHYIRLGNLKSRYPFIAWGSMDVINTGNNSICAYRITDNWKESPTYGKSVVVAHNTNYDHNVNEKFTLPTAQWIDSLCARDFTWKAGILPGNVIDLPSYTSAVIGEY